MAHLLDGVLLLGPFFLAFVGLLVAEESGTNLTDDDIGGTFFVAFLVTLPVVIANIYYLAHAGQTLGKKAFKIRIVRTSGEKAGFWRIYMADTKVVVA